MPILMLIIVGTAAGFLATRVLKMNTSVMMTIAIGIAGALIGGLILRAVSVLAGALGSFVGAVLGALLLIWIWKKLKENS
ncbi:GlsB/YeaQ/YmgE family stress response membrane protein [Pacificibacter marinus]|uniref:Transglycosylase associated protein n=1 Tax=Pacificibacter marinus TaxID=658057 RepID=A0A1Y5S482_9RHOB|nr:GlsB/YeaQ/YmgE family stress response membrane protein [Pacificibacter marinus]SEK90116.1 Transglycosylase associated protein [Pacificibacter marinus]SLN32274.1 hypothetical protein PAM7971_01269 [Pacificibacter marinus]